MASLVEELIQLLEEETGCYTLLLEMADNKKDVIINGDLPGLQKLTKQEQELAGLLLRLEKKRSTLLDDICLVTNRKPEDMTVSKLIEMLQGQKDEQSRLTNAVEALTTVVIPLKEANQLNQQLIEQSLEFVDFTMNALQSSKEPITSNSYKPSGKAYGQAQSTNFFDAKQ
jgi:flagellar biosynthesis/type III secretory pathway chaperone